MKRKPAIEALTGLRGVAALLVLGLHFHNAIMQWSGHAARFTDIFAAGYLGVDVFFALSGFVLAYNYPALADRKEYLAFLRKRLARIYPVHCGALALLVVSFGGLAIAGIHYHSASYLQGGSLIANLLLIQSWAFPIEKSWNVPAWSISAEWLAYLCFPICLWLASKLNRTTQLVLAIVAMYSLLAVATALGHIGGHMGYGLFRIGAGFAAGVFAHKLWTLHASCRLAGVLASMALAGLVIGGAALELHYRRWSALHFLPALSVVLVLALAYPSGMSRQLSRPVWDYLGRLSFSLYMVHWIVLEVVTSVIVELPALTGPEIALVAGATMAICLALASVFYHGIEEPARRWLTGSRNRSARDVVLPSTVGRS